MTELEVQNELATRWEQCLAAFGEEPLVSGLLLTPERDFFPDAWASDLRSVRRIVQRCLVYLGLPAADIEIEVVAEEVEPEAEAGKTPFVAPRMQSGIELPAWLLEQKSGKTIRIAVLKAGLTAPDLMLLSLARACVHALCRSVSLVATRSHDDPLIDIAAIYVGFGILTTNAAHHHTRASGRSRYLQLGSIGPSAAAHALAWFCRARQLDARARREVLRRLSPNQADVFRRISSELERSDAPTLAFLDKLSEPSRWPPPRDPIALRRTADLQVQTTDDARAELEKNAVEAELGIVGKNKGKPVFLVRRTLSKRVLKFGMGLLFLGSMLLRSDRAIELDTGIYFGIGIPAVLVAGLFGLLFKERRCSEPKCDARLTEDMTQCPRCGGEIRGIIGNAKERLRALEEK